MARRQYPALDSVKWLGEQDNPGIQCCACAKPACAYARVEWSCMNGEDESYPVCQRHGNMAQDKFRRFMAHMNTKDKFVEKTP